MTNFDPKDENERLSLSDEELLAYYHDALAAGHPSAADALGNLVFRYYGDVKRRCRIKVPPGDVEDVAMEAVVSAIKSSLEGRSMGEFRTWLNTIVGRRIADYTRKPSVDTTALPEEHEDDEAIWGDSGHVDPETGEVEVQQLIDQVMADLSDAHRDVIDLFVFADLPAAEVVERVNADHPDLDPPMSIDNVSQIAKRFREELRRLLEESDNPDPG